MPSQEEYRNQLLKEMSEAETEEAPGLEELADMSEEQIAQLLAHGEAAKPSEAAAGDILDLDSRSGDSDLREIQELLEKSDRNEAVETVEDSRNEENPAARLMADIEKAGETEVTESAVDAKKKRALEKKRLKEEKKAAKEAAKAAKKEKRKSRKGTAAGAEKTEIQQQEKADSVQEYDMLQDRELLDSIVSEAGKVEHGDTTGQEEASAVDLMEVAAALEAERNVDISQEVPYAEENAQSGNDVESDILALDPDEVDDLIPDISESGREEEKQKKKGVVSRFVNFLMEEEEEPENEDIQISDENQEIIREMDGAEAENAKKKIEKKAKKKKEKKKKEQKPKKPKPAKPKKVKKPKEADPYPVRKLGFKKVFPVVLLGISLGAALFIFVFLSADYTGKQSAKEAFQTGDYQSCYVNLYGESRNEAEEQMYHKSECILHIQMWFKEYQMLEGEGSELKALDSLIQSVHEYPTLYEYAFRWSAEAEVAAVYTEILNILYGKYGLTEVQAQEIAALKSDIAYTRAVMAAVSNAGYGEGSAVPEQDSAGNFSGGEDPDTAPEGNLPEGEGSDMAPEGNLPEGEDSDTVPDELPEEEGMEPGDFTDD